MDGVLYFGLDSVWSSSPVFDKFNGIVRGGRIIVRPALVGMAVKCPPRTSLNQARSYGDRGGNNRSFPLKTKENGAKKGGKGRLPSQNEKKI